LFSEQNQKARGEIMKPTVKSRLRSSILPLLTSAASGNSAKVVYVFRLYIAVGAPNSVRGLANLNAICRKYFPNSHRIEVIDVMKEPRRALAEAIIVLPTVVKLSPLPEQQIIGDLSEEEEVLRALGLPPLSHSAEKALALALHIAQIKTNRRLISY
jgi:circadian clock protein KaiB